MVYNTALIILLSTSYTLTRHTSVTHITYNIHIYKMNHVFPFHSIDFQLCQGRTSWELPINIMYRAVSTVKDGLQSCSVPNRHRLWEGAGILGATVCAHLGSFKTSSKKGKQSRENVLCHPDEYRMHHK